MGVDQETCNRKCGIYCEFGVAWCRANGSLLLAVSIANALPKGSQTPDS
jgi:hypothetical protein